MPVIPVASAAAAPAAALPAAPTPAGGFAARLEARLQPVAPSETTGAALASVFRGVEAAQARLDQVLAAARTGRTFTAGQLLALQADAYRFTQALDVASKVVETGVQGVKQVVATPL